MHFELDQEQGHTGYSRPVSTLCFHPEASRIHMSQLKTTANLSLPWCVCYKVRNSKFITRGILQRSQCVLKSRQDLTGQIAPQVIYKERFNPGRTNSSSRQVIQQKESFLGTYCVPGTKTQQCAVGRLSAKSLLLSLGCLVHNTYKCLLLFFI